MQLDQHALPTLVALAKKHGTQDAALDVLMQWIDGAVTELTRLQDERNRLWDLCRLKRLELYVDDCAISEEEYAAFAKDHAAVIRLETNDGLRAQRDQMKRQIHQSRIDALESCLILVQRIDMYHAKLLPVTKDEVIQSLQFQIKETKDKLTKVKG